MKKLTEWLSGAWMFALLAGCGSDGTDPMAPPEALEVPAPVVTVNGAEATVRWSTIENARQYGWELKAGEEDETPETGTSFVNNKSFTMNDGIVYEFRVRALARSGSEYKDSEWSEYVTASSNMLSAPKPVVDRASLTDTSATLEWEAVEDAGSYKYELIDNQGTTVKSGSVEVLSVTFDELKEGATYQFRALAVTANKEKSDSPWSAYVAFTTRAHEQLAAPVLSLDNRTAVSVTVSWKAVQGAAKYAYKLYETADENTPVKEDETTELAVTLGNLKEATSYKFTVRAMADADDPYTSDSEEASILATTKTAAAASIDFGIPTHEMDGIIRAFPGAEGAGMFTTGGRGGAVYHVTNLNDTGDGSLRNAVGKSGARTIVFDVAGTIELKSTLKIANGNLTIAGQTAPGDGICIKGYGVEVNADNVIIRYLRIRPGDEAGNGGMDALGGRYMQNIIIDHCSLSWSTDECVSFYVNRNMTMQYCLAYESLRNGKHEKGTHGYGGIWGGAPASFHHNILAHHDSRNPRLDSPEQYGDGPTPGATAKAKGINRTDRKLDFRNNVVYNFCNFPAYGGVDITMNFVGNYYKWGPASVNGAGPDAKGTIQNGKARQYFASLDTYYDNNGVSNTPEKCVMGNPKIYYGANTNKLDTSVKNAATGAAITSNNQTGFVHGTTSGAGGDCPWSPVFAGSNYPIVTIPDGKACYVTTHTADESFNVLTQYCGASLRPDKHDIRVLADVKNGTGESGHQGETTSTGLGRSWNGLIDSQTDVGGWPELKATAEELAKTNDSDGDGIPDYYEDLFGLDSEDKSDGNKKDLDPQGLYTNLEMYLHYLVKEITLAQTATGTYAEIK